MLQNSTLDQHIVTVDDHWDHRVIFYSPVEVQEWLFSFALTELTVSM